MIQLHYYPSTASMVPHILLEELAVPYERVLVDRAQDVQKTMAYLKLNPNGLIPVLVDGDLVLYETAAICLHLSDTHPQAKLMPALGTAERAPAYKWLMWLTNTLQATLITYFYPERSVAPGNVAGAAEVKAQAILIEKLRHQLAGHRAHRFGASSETAEQLQLALETSEIAAAAMTARMKLPDIEEKDKPKRRPIPDHIPRMEVELTPGADASSDA